MIQSLRRAITLQLICNDYPRHVPQPLQQLAEEPLGGLFVPAALDQDVQDVAILIHGSPQIMILTTDLDEHLIQMPLVTGSRTLAAQFVSVCLTKLEAPFTDRFIGNDNAAHGHNLFDIAKAQSEAEVKPHCVANDFGKEAMATIERSSGVHRRIMQQLQICSTLASLS